MNTNDYINLLNNSKAINDKQTLVLETIVNEFPFYNTEFTTKYYLVDPSDFDALYNRVTEYLGHKELYVRDAYACADPNYNLNIRVINEYPWSNMFASNMFLRPDKASLASFDPEWVIINAPGFMANPERDGTRQHNFAILNFTRKMILIGGTGYTGEIKKGIFSALNFILPHQKNVLSMHCSANIGKDNDTAIFFGLSGTGKTTLSSDPNRRLIGDDEHGWSDTGVFNFEGGCYAKTYQLSQENEPGIYKATNRFVALCENVVLDENTGVIDFSSKAISENGRSSYPLEFVGGIEKSARGGIPKHMFFLSADAFGILPPVSKLTKEQAMYHFMSGYTAKVAGTEMGVTEPVATFSSCFGAAFMVWKPTVYAKLLAEKITQHNTSVWLINTGWIGGGYGVGKRIDLKYTRAMIDAIHENLFQDVAFHTESYFNLSIPASCSNVPSNILNPIDAWSDKDAYMQQANKLKTLFDNNILKFQ